MAPPPQTTALTDDLLEEIFLRIASPTDLAHVSTACVSFRRLIADSTFLRRYRSLHPPLLLGFLDPGRRFRPAEAPHPNARAARALACAADFSFDYLPRGRSWWCPQDVRDGRVLLCGRPDEDAVFMDLVVCDPVSRRYLLLPPVPDDLLASVQVQKQHVLFLDAFLVPSGAEQGEASFSVLGRVCCVSKMVALVFSSASGHWDVGTSTSWNAENPSALSVTEGMFLGWPSYAYGCFFWKVISSSKLLKLDINRMKFSIVDLPPDHVDRNVIIVETGEGRLGMFTNVSHVSSGTLIHYDVRKIEGESSIEWQMSNIIPGIPDVEGTLGTACFSLNIKNLKIEAVSQMEINYSHVYPYFGFPPFMLPRMI